LGCVPSGTPSTDGRRDQPTHSLGCAQEGGWPVVAWPQLVQVNAVCRQSFKREAEHEKAERLTSQLASQPAAGRGQGKASCSLIRTERGGTPSVDAFLGDALGEVFGDEELLMGVGALRPSRTHSPSSSSSNSADDFDILSNGTNHLLLGAPQHPVQSLGPPPESATRTYHRFRNIRKSLLTPDSSQGNPIYR